MSIVNALIGFTIGDALGAPFEGWSGSRIRISNINFSYYYKTNRGPKGSYTDDSEMMMLTIMCLLQHKYPSRNDFFSFYKNLDIKRGYGSNTKLRLQNKIAKNIFSNKISNGILMRMLPIALIFRKNIIMRNWIIYQNALSTSHINELCLHSAQLYSDMIALICENPQINISEILSYLEDYKCISILKKKLKKIINSYNDNKLEYDIISWEFMYEVSNTICYSIICFIRNFNNPSTALSDIILQGGDTDTHASIVGSLIGLRFGNVFSPTLIKKLENINTLNKIYNMFNQVQKLLN